MQVANPTADVSYSAGWKGQTVTAMMGAYAYSSFPFIMDLTDGAVHHLLHLRGRELYYWTSLTPQQVGMQHGACPTSMCITCVLMPALAGILEASAAASRASRSPGIEGADVGLDS